MDYKISDAAMKVKSSAVRDILQLTQKDSVISFAGGLPAEELFPRTELGAAFERVFESGNKALQYGPTEGYLPLRELIGTRMQQKQMRTSTENTLLATGSQQVLDLFSRVMIQPGDVILTENPTYLAALQVFHFQGAHVIAVNTDDEGMDPIDLDEKIREFQPKFIYVIPTFANPTGVIWSVARRQRILQVCRDLDVLILEDDPYGDIKFFEDETYPTLFSLDDAADGRVVYTSTFSKTVVPALRIGWVTGPAQIIEYMKRAKQAADLHSSSLDQQALFQLLTHFDIDQHIREIRKIYKERMQTMVSELSQRAWADVSWTVPKGGMFLWLKLPGGIDAEELLKVAVGEGVAFVPGSEFFVGKAEKNTLRLNFSHSGQERIALGIDRFAKSLHAMHASLS